MNLVELDHALRKLRLSGMAATLETRLLEAQSERRAPIDLVSTLVHDELVRRQDRLLARRIDEARFRDRAASLDRFDFEFNPKMNRRLVFDLATARFIEQHEDVALPRTAGHGQEPPGPGHRPRRHRARATRSPTARPTASSRSSPMRRSTGRARSTSPA